MTPQQFFRRYNELHRRMIKEGVFPQHAGEVPEEWPPGLSAFWQWAEELWGEGAPDWSSCRLVCMSEEPGVDARLYLLGNTYYLIDGYMPGCLAVDQWELANEEAPA